MRWAINEVPIQLEDTRRKKHTGCCKHALDGIPTNIYEENSALKFRVQCERELNLENDGNGIHVVSYANKLVKYSVWAGC